jgi:hypothetical protein
VFQKKTFAGTKVVVSQKEQQKLSQAILMAYVFGFQQNFITAKKVSGTSKNAKAL